MNDAAGVFCCPLCFVIAEDRDIWARHRQTCHSSDAWLDSVEPKVREVGLTAKGSRAVRVPMRDS